MSLPILPTGFERATGVVEGRRQCEACGHTYPVTDHASSKQCPSCNSSKTVPLGEPAGK